MRATTSPHGSSASSTAATSPTGTAPSTRNRSLLASLPGHAVAPSSATPTAAHKRNIETASVRKAEPHAELHLLVERAARDRQVSDLRREAGVVTRVASLQ